MKKIFNSLFVIVASMVTFAGCQKEENNAPASQTKTVEFFANSIETKTHFDDKSADNKYPTLWDAGDKVKVLMNLESPTGISGLEKISAGLTASDIFNDGASARFKVELNDGTPDEQGDVYISDSYTYYAVVPSSAYNTKSTADGGRVTVIIPTAQTPQAKTVDKAAQIIYAVSEAYPSIQDAVSLDFKHFTAYGKFSLTNLTNQIGTIKTVALKFDGVNIAGKWNYYPSTDTKGVHEAGSNTITLTTSSATDIWFACAPVDVSGKNLKVTVTDVQGKQLVKEITMPADRVFKSGKVSTFTVNMSDIVPPAQEETTKYFQKVTQAPSDWSGRYLIVYEGTPAYWDGSLTPGTNTGQMGKEVGMVTTTILSNNRIESNADVNKSIIEIIKSGSGYALKASSGSYMGMSGNSNGISSSTSSSTYVHTLTLNADKTVSIVSSDNKTQVAYNKGSKFFRYYKVATVSGTPASYPLPCLYKLVDGDVGGETPEPDEPETPVDPTPDPEDPETPVDPTPDQPGQGGSGEPTTVTMTSFSATSASMDNNVSYTTAKGGGTTAPGLYSGVIRLYQNSNGTGGGTITITAADGYKLSSVTIGSSMATSVAYTIGTSTNKSTSASVTQNGKYTVEDINATSITFYCMGKTSSSRLYVNYLSATYEAK